MASLVHGQQVSVGEAEVGLAGASVTEAARPQDDVVHLTEHTQAGEPDDGVEGIQEVEVDDWSVRVMAVVVEDDGGGSVVVLQLTQLVSGVAGEVLGMSGY